MPESRECRLNVHAGICRVSGVLNRVSVGQVLISEGLNRALGGQVLIPKGLNRVFGGRFRVSVEGELKVVEIPYIELAADVDRTLKSPAFGLQSTYSPPTEEKIQRYHQLNRKRRTLAGEEKQECEQLELFMKVVQPFSDRPEPGSLEDRINSFLEEHLS